jgi:hypothetical protein
MGINLELPPESSMQSQHGMANSGLSTIGASNGFAVQLRALARPLQRLVRLLHIPDEPAIPRVL